MFRFLRGSPVLPWVGNKLRAARTGGETDPAILRGLACGAHLIYSNGDRWNVVVDPRPAPELERLRLTDSWGVTSADEWHHMVQELLDGQVSTPMWDAAMGARAALLARAEGAPVTERAWSEAAGTWLVDRLGPHHPGLRDASTALQEVIVRVPRYEARFREDGILAPGAHVRRTLAWDLGRAANMCCWGVNAGFGAPDEARQALRVIGESAAEEYATWADFSLGYVLGRCLHFDEDLFGNWYREVRDSHRLLTSRPESPWAMVELHS